MKDLIQLAAQRVLRLTPSFTDQSADIKLDEYLIPLGSPNAGDIQQIHMNGNELAKIQGWLNAAFASHTKTFFLKINYLWYLLYWEKGDGWYLLDQKGHQTFIQKNAQLNGPGRNFFNSKALVEYKLIPATPQRVIALVDALQIEVVDATQSLPPVSRNVPAARTVFVPQGVSVQPQKSDSWFMHDIVDLFTGSRVRGKTSAGYYERTNNHTIANDCSECAIEIAAKRLGFGDIRITYKTKLTDQVDITPAFASAPDPDKIQWYSVGAIDFGRLDKESTYIARKGTAGDNAGGHWQTLYYSRQHKGWVMHDEFVISQLTGEDSELTVDGYRYLGCTSQNWGQGTGQYSLCLTKASAQLIINATHFIVAYREKDASEDELLRDILGMQVYKLQPGDLRRNSPNCTPQQTLQRILGHASELSDHHNSNANAASRKHLAGLIQDLLKPASWDMLMDGAYQSVKQSAGTDAVKNNQIQLNARVIKAHEGQRPASEILGTRRQALDIMVPRVNATEYNTAERNPVTIRLIRGDAAEQGIPEVQKAAVLNHSFNLSPTDDSNAIRHLTKWRAVTSEVKLLANKHDFFDEMQVFMQVTTGTAPAYDEANQNAYIADLSVILRAWLEEQDKTGVKIVVLPYFWVSRKDDAHDPVDDAVNTVILNFYTNSRNVQQIYLVATAIPEVREAGILRINKDEEAVVDTELLRRTQGQRADVLDVMLEIKRDLANDQNRKNEHIGLINITPDNCIGGKCAIKKNPETRLAYTTVQEPSDDIHVQLADFSSLVLHQTMDFNTLKFNIAVTRLGVQPKHEPDPPFPEPVIALHVHPAAQQCMTVEQVCRKRAEEERRRGDAEQLGYARQLQAQFDAERCYAYGVPPTKALGKWYMPVLRTADLSQPLKRVSVNAFKKYMFDNNLVYNQYQSAYDWLTGIGPDQDIPAIPDDVKQTLELILDRIPNPEDQHVLELARRERQKFSGFVMTFLPQFTSLEHGKKVDTIQVRDPSGGNAGLEDKQRLYNQALQESPITISGISYVFEINLVEGRLMLDKKINLATDEKTVLTHEDKVNYANEQGGKNLVATLMDKCRDWIAMNEGRRGYSQYLKLSSSKTL